jgi:transcriptional regulator PpsR
VRLNAQGIAPLKPFTAPKRTIGDLKAETAAQVVAATADVALVVEPDGVIRDVAFGSDELAQALHARKWIGKPWADTVTAESRKKVDALMRDAARKADPRWRHLNYPSARGTPDVPVLHVAVKAGTGNALVCVGRSLGEMAALQQRLVEAQQTLERDYLRLRHAETRYRLLFQMAAEGILIVDAGTLRILEANPAAAQLLGARPSELVGRTVAEGLDAESAGALRALLAVADSAGRTDNRRLRLGPAGQACLATASVFRQENATLFLVRLAPADAKSAAAALGPPRAQLLSIVQSAPDGIVVTDPDGRILAANPAFLELAQLATEAQARGQPLDRWLGRQGVDLGVLTANLRQHGVVRLFATTLRGELGSSAEVEISAVAVANGEQPCLGFMVRDVARRIPAEPRTARSLPRSVEQLAELVGRVSLKDIVREATDVIERLCIEAALELTRDNRASAAELLGLSRQSLYVKLHRYGLGELAAEGGGGR